MECPDENTIVALAEGTLAHDVRGQVAAHATGCVRCGELLTAARTVLERRTVVGGADVVPPPRPAPSNPAAAVARGASIGRYTILSLVGMGGMGEVYAAYDPELDRKVALKLLLPDGAHDLERGQARLLREAKALARVSHPNVVGVHDAGTFGARVFLAMDFVEGVTLRTWLAERVRTRQEILEVFTAAARGLIAAHAAGLVHRDFKPANVMIAKDGGVRVADFGLARALGEAQDAPEGDQAAPLSSVDPNVTLTLTGQLLGTPRYMAPEQFKSAAVDERTDQFSFCVALYEALYGEGPFGDQGLAALTAAVLAGRVRPAPPKSTVPTWLRGVILRGLSAAPEARWPSMRELIAALTADPSAARRRWATAVGVALLAALPAIFLARQSHRSASLCRGGPARLTGAWEPAASSARPQREAVQRAFLASGAPNAKEVWERIPVLLDRYVTGWLAQYEDACGATHVRGEQSEAVLDLRMACLDERRTAVAALTDVFAHADREVVGKAVDAALALPDLGRCGDIAALQLPIEPPHDEATRATVANLRPRIATIKALKDTGKTKQALQLEGPVLREARASGYRPILAEALALSGDFDGALEGKDITQRLEEAIWLGLAVGRNDLAAMTAVTRVGAYYYFAPDLSEAPYWIGLARAILDRAGPGQERVRSWLLQNQGLMKERANDLPAAVQLMREARTLKERILPKGHPDIALSLQAEAEALHRMGKNDEALRKNAEARAMFIAAYGAGSVEAAFTLSNHGEYLNDLGRQAEALEPLRQALTLWEAHTGPDHSNLAFPLTALGRALVALGRAREAVPPLERALRLRDPKDTDPADVAVTQFALAQALGTGAERARTLATSARGTYQQLSRKPELDAVDAWLATAQRPKQAR